MDAKDKCRTFGVTVWATTALLILILSAAFSNVADGLTRAGAASADGGPVCPASWPTGDYEDFFADTEGRRWFIIRATDSNGYTTVRAYEGSDLYDSGYVADSPDRVCYLLIRSPENAEDVAEPRQVTFPKEQEEPIARDTAVSVPPKSSPDDYTKHFVNQAIRRYEMDGLDATLAYYNSEESVDGQWYVFIIDENDRVIGHPDARRLGLDVKGWVGTDANGYRFGPEMLSATEGGKWVSYVYRNPERGGIGGAHGNLELKNVWVVRHDDLLFASGWYINSDEVVQSIVAAFVEQFRLGGLKGVVEFFTNPGTVFSGLASTIDYYRSVEGVKRTWFAFIVDPDGEVVLSRDRTLLGSKFKDLLGIDDFEASSDGNWVTTESLRFWAMERDSWLFASGWYQ